MTYYQSNQNRPKKPKLLFYKKKQKKPHKKGTKTILIDDILLL
ncbi:hypothetical protein N473_13125 [Pseudoalteromonas luteoviolacea CPMOR-1]|uniref:Uncharacterized protein n=1 Tax=Pseudoalteromonas luteoviolacea CPMOR-1 TaxID=1365248 RepID=A0A167LKL0_9GAMM|nr:hypothetical protein N473_13125 [Pseudoalteromonas luteoviolacea CPMOR-1]